MTTPEKIQLKMPIELASPQSEAALPGQLLVEKWDDKAARKRARGITLKILGRIFMVLPLGLFVHILIPIILVTGTVALIGSPILYTYLASQKATFNGAEGKCPSCGAENQLKPYLWRTVASTVTLLCGSCGQTCSAQVRES